MNTGDDDDSGDTGDTGDTVDDTTARDRHARLERLFHDALDLPTDRVDAYLAEHCPDDDDLQAEVKDLLRAHTGGGVFDELTPQPEHETALPERVGDYRIVRKLGEGGMGLVFLAQREGADYTQTVALKLIRAGFMDPALDSRFREERRILARLEHPGIARFIDGGVTDAGQPFYAMEVFEGTDVLTHAHRLALSIRQRLELFLDVLAPVQYAHQQLVVHRDLKPSNVQVSPDGKVKLLDFGVAKLLEPDRAGEGERTAAWATPSYAAPEQVRGEPAATLADVYALGVILYQLVAGARPYEVTGKTPSEIEQVVCEQTHPRPSEVVSRENRRALSGDIDTIVMKAMATDPSRRYGSVAELSDDLRRHLTGHPVMARPDSVRYRVSKFASRNRTAVAAGTLVAASLVVGIATTTWQARQAAQQRDVAAAEAARAEQVKGLMMEVFRMSDPTQTLGDTVTAREILDAGTARIEREFVDQPDVQAELLVEVAAIHRNLGTLDRAEELLRESVDLRASHFGPDSREVSHSLIHLGRLLSEKDQDDEGMPMLERAIVIRDVEGADGDTVLASGLAALATRYRAHGESEKAHGLWERSLAIRQATLAPDDPQIAETMMGIAAALHEGGELDRAMSQFSRILEEYGSGERPHPLAATAAVQIALVHRLRGEYRAADSVIRRAVQIREALFEPNHPDVIEVLQEFGTTLESRGAYADARGVLEDVRERAVALYGAEHPVISSSDEMLAIVEVTMGDYEAASVRYDTILAAKRRRFGDHPDPVFTLLRAAEAPLAGGDFEAARARADSAIALRTRLAGGQLPNGRGVLAILSGSVDARIADYTGDVAAGALFEEIASLADSALRTNHRYRLRVQLERGIYLTDRGRAGQATAVLEEVAELQRDRLGDMHEGFGRAAHGLGRAYAAMGQWADAQRWLNQAIRAYAELPREHWRIGAVRALLAAVAARQSGEAYPEAVEDAVRVAEAHLGPEHPRVVRLRALLAGLGSRRPVA